MTRHGACLASLFLTCAMASAQEADKLAEGAAVFATVAGVGCKTCHGEYAEGDLGVGPFIRGASEGTIRAAIDAIGEMMIVKNAISEAEIRAVSAYVGHLGTLQVARTLAKRGRFLPDEFSTRPGTPIQLIIENSGIEPHTFRSDDMGVDDITVAPRGAGSIEWQAPGEEGEFTLYCTDCRLKEQFFSVKVDADAAEFKGHAAVGAVVADGEM